MTGGRGSCRCLVASLTLLALTACAPMETSSDPRYGMVTPSWGEVLSSLGDVVSTSASEEGDVEVVVDASGETMQAAREEAVRTALQSTVSQLVITDRLVENSEVVRNDIFATQNGFVTGFEVLERDRSEYGEHEIRARVRVSEDTILNYVALQEGSESSVDGESLFAEVRRSSRQREVLNEMIDRFVQGYPWEVISLDLTAIEPVTGHDDRVRASLTAVSDAGYFIALQQFLARIAVMSYQTSVDFDSYPGRHDVEAFVKSDDRRYSGLPRDRVLRVPTTHASVEYCVAPRPRVKEVALLGKITMDVDQQGRIRARCYLLPPGDYLPQSWQARGSYRNIVQRFGQGDALALLVTFLDDTGRSTVRRGARDRVGKCLLVGGGAGYPAPGVYMSTASEGSPEKGLPFRVKVQQQRGEHWGSNPSSIVLSDVDTHFNVVFRTGDVDFSRVTSFRGRPVIAARMDRRAVVMKEPGAEAMSPEALCEELLQE